MRVKKIVVIVAVVFAAFYLFTRPTQAAAAVHGAFDLVITGANSLATFFSKVTT